MRTVPQKVGDWYQAFDMVRRELVPDEWRTILAKTAEVDGAAMLTSYMQLAQLVAAGDRMAAQVAATLTQSGVRAPSQDD